MENETKHSYPYSDILDGLIVSVMQGQRAVVAHCVAGKPLSLFDHRKINLNFCWLSYLNKAGKNRHLVEAPDGMSPLGNSSLRNKTTIPNELKSAFENQTFPSLITGKTGEQIIPAEFEKYVQEGPTRISSLITNSFHELLDLGIDQGLAPDLSPFHIRSPLSIVFDYLTVPDSLGTRAYALMACRNYLFRAFELAPDLDGLGGAKTFSVQEIERSLSHIWTSFRDRYLSRGDDKLPPGSPGNIDGLIRHHLAMKEMLYLRFDSGEACLEYLQQGDLVSVAPSTSRTTVSEKGKRPKQYKFEFSRSKRLSSLPDAGEIVNELWGLPIPFRGADIVFKGGLKFSGRKGLVMAIHGGPGAGKTSFALALAAHVIPFGISSWFLSAEEIEKDLVDRVNGLLPDQISRLNFFPKDVRDYIKFTKFKLREGSGAKALTEIESGFSALEDALMQMDDFQAPLNDKAFRLPRPCKAIVILDGLHDLFATGFSRGQSDGESLNQLERLYSFVEKLKELQALVILTTGTAWAGDSVLDYLVDVAIRLSHESTEEYGKKPDRRFILTKARHQLCSGGTHGLQIGGMKGVRLSPQINYQLEKLSLWRPRLPDKGFSRTGLCRARAVKSIGELADLAQTSDIIASGKNSIYIDSQNSVPIYEGSHVFLNGQGSGGKAALAIKLAISPIFRMSTDIRNREIISSQHRVLVISFLYPADYYEQLVRRLRTQQHNEYRNEHGFSKTPPRVEVIHLYPGHLRPNDLFNRIEWALEAAELNADPYTCAVIDGIHNVFLQFPEIEKYGLFWPQIYSALRSRKITTITTHTTLALPYQNWNPSATKVDDNRSEPLRHALVQKTDFQFEVDSWANSPFQNGWEGIPSEFAALSDLYVVKVVSAIGQRIPRGHILWSREHLELYELPKQYFENLFDDRDAQLPLT